MQREKNRQADKESFSAILEKLTEQPEVSLLAETKALATRIRYLFYAARQVERNVGNPLWANGVVVRILPRQDNKWDLVFCRDGYDSVLRQMLAASGFGPVDQGSSNASTVPKTEPVVQPVDVLPTSDGGHQADALARIFKRDKIPPTKGREKCPCVGTVCQFPDGSGKQYANPDCPDCQGTGWIPPMEEQEDLAP